MKANGSTKVSGFILLPFRGIGVSKHITRHRRLEYYFDRRYQIVVSASSGLTGHLTPPLVRRYLTSVITTISSKGQIVLPAELRQQDRIEPGQEFEVERIDRGEYLLKRKTRQPNEGLVRILLSCPVKDWFRPLDRSETIDEIVPLKLG